MSVLDQVVEQFDSSVQSRGRDYFRQGLVKIRDASTKYLLAEVQGGELYDVEIRWNKSARMRGSCTCPYAEDYGPCKHIWATLLQAQKQGVLPSFSPAQPVARGLAHPLQLLDELLSPRRGVLARAVESVVRRVNAPPQPPAWKRHLADLRRAMQNAEPRADSSQPWPANRQLAYVVDLEQSISHDDALTIDLSAQSLDKSGQWGPPKPARINRSQIARLPDERDRVIVQMLAGIELDSYYGDSDRQLECQYSLEGRDYDLLLRRMCDTGRCYLRSEDCKDSHMDPLSWDDGGSWELWIEVKPDDKGVMYTLDASLRRGEQRMDCRRPSLVSQDGLVLLDGKAGRLDHFGAFPMLEFLRHSELKVTLAVAQADEMLAELLSMSPLPRLDLPAELKVETIAPPMHPRLKISPASSKYAYDNKLVGTMAFDYGGRIIPECATVPLFDAKSRTLLRRDSAAEAGAAARLDELKFKFQYGYDYSGQHRRLAPNKLNKVVLQLCTEGWHIEADGKLYRQAGEFKIEVTTGIDWFELNGSLDFGGVSARLPRLLAALRRGEKTVQLDDGTLGILPDEWLKRYGMLARIAPKDDEDHLRFTRTQVGLLDALVADMPQASCDAAFERARQELCHFDGIVPSVPPPAFIGELRPYQCQGLGWLNFLNRFGFGGCLADDMGLGKTVQVLALLESRREMAKPSLVVVPRSLVFNWINEAARFTPNLRVLDHSGVDRAKSTEHFANYDVILTTYGTLRLDALFLKDFQFDYAILDEAQAIKNSSSESAKAARLIRADHRLALSGTPVQNHLGELWSLFEFLNPGMLGGSSVFKVSGAGSMRIETEARELLSRALRPFILRRTKVQVAPELPEKTEQTIWCDLEPEQRKLYDELRDHYRASLLGRIEAEGINKAKILILEALLRLRQAACHPGLIDKARVGQSSAKLDSMLPQLSEVIEENHKVLVFSQFTSMLAIVKKHLGKQKIDYEYLDGQTRDRQAKVDRFQNDPECKLFLISLKAGGLGLNLTAAEYVFLLDPWWNPAVESQAIDRAHRIGQTRHVFAYRFIARDTVEQKVLELQAGKKDLADMIINADNSLIGELRREDLEMLLS